MSDSFKNKTITEFITLLESKSPTPGGGSTAAIGVAMSAGLIAMVANLTIGKKNYESANERMQKILEDVLPLKDAALALADEDSLAFEKVMTAYKLPAEDTTKQEKIQEALKYAAEVPYKVMTICMQLKTLAQEVAQIGNKNAYSDAKSAEYFAYAAMLSAIENVKINLSSITDEDWKKTITLPQINDER